MFISNMATPAIPERVFTLCKIVEKNHIASSDAREKMEPSYLNQKTSYYNDYKTAAEELGLIITTDNLLSLAVDSSVIKNMETMRFYINGQLERFKEGQFYKVTKAYFSAGEDILHGEKNVANMAQFLSVKAHVQVESKEMRAWRFWASYLGFGYMQDMLLLPNADVFLQDIIRRAKFEKNHMYSVTDFVNKLRPYSDIIIDPFSESKIFSYGVSNGLRTLHDSGFIKMENIMDQEDKWNLYHLPALSTSETVTNVTVLK